MWAGGDGWMAAAAFRILGFWQEADEPPTRGSGGGGSGAPGRESECICVELDVCVSQACLGLSRSVEVSVEVCRGLARPVEACRGSVECRGLTP
jgi:hypothetical protein